MQFTVKTGTTVDKKSPCLVLGIFTKGQLSAAAEAADKASGGGIRQALKRGDIPGEPGQTLLLYDLVGIASERVLLVGCGDAGSLTRANFRKAIAAAAISLNQSACTSALVDLGGLQPAGLGLYYSVRDLVLTAEEAVYRFDELKTNPDKPKRPLKRLTLYVEESANLAEARSAAAHGSAMAKGVQLAKDLGNLPGNICTPSYLADKGRALAKTYDKLKAEVLEQKDMEKLGMGALLSVSRGSRQPPKLICMHYRGAKSGDRPVVLVGKGLTFDAGGISLKPAAAMDEMKFDMCGGASVFGAVAACAELDLPINLIGVVPASENLPDGDANKPGDIVTSMSGQTIEVLNTDAEGRLLLCDALTYCERFKPATVIDIATLTGACVVALGKHASGMMSENEALAQEILEAGERSADRAWRLPLWEDYQTQLDTNFADMANIGGKEAGAVTAGCFLSRFTKKYAWAHLDIAGSAWLSGDNKGATGRPVPLLTQLLLRRCKRAE